MNKNIDLTKILKDCPEGTKLYSTIFGDVTFCYIDKSAEYQIILTAERGCNCSVSADGRNYVYFDGECTSYLSIYPQFVIPFRKVISESKDILFGKGKSNEQKFKEVLNLIDVSFKAVQGTINLINKVLSIKRIGD